MATQELTAEVLEQRLLAPFTPEELEIRVGPSVRSKKVPLFYIDPRSAEHRLRKVFGIGGYSIRVTNLIANEDRKDKTQWVDGAAKVVGEERGLLVSCSVSIAVDAPPVRCVVENVGEKGLDEPGYNKTTSAYAQGFKRAIAALGIGAYLYGLKMPPQDYSKERGFGFTIPPDDLIIAALKEVGFRFICEQTGEQVPWRVAALAVNRTGRVLGETALKAMRAAKAQ